MDNFHLLITYPMLDTIQGILNMLFLVVAIALWGRYFYKWGN